MTILDVRPTPTSADTSNEIDHYFCCCSRWIGLCGADLSNDGPECIDCDHPECEACVALLDAPCILCGRSNDDPCFCGRCS